MDLEPLAYEDVKTPEMKIIEFANSVGRTEAAHSDYPVLDWLLSVLRILNML